MSKIVSIVTIITALIVIVLSILQLVQGIFFPGVQALFVALLMACLAYSHYQKHHKRKLVFWLLIAAGVLNLVIGLVVLM